MNKLTIIAAFLLNLVVYATTAVIPPRTNSTLLDVLVESESNPSLKCPYLRTKLLDNKFTFLKECPAITNTKGNDGMMCTVFSNNFFKLCNLSSLIEIKSLLNDSTFKASYDINFACNNLKAIESFDASYETIITHIKNFMEKNCLGTCTNFMDDKILPICAISGLMTNIIKQINTNLVIARKENDGKIEKAALESEKKHKNEDVVKGKKEEIKKIDGESIVQPAIQPQNQPKSQDIPKPDESQSQNQPQQHPIIPPKVENNVQNNPENVVPPPKDENVVAPASKDELKEPTKDKIESGDVKGINKPSEDVDTKPKQEHQENNDDELTKKKSENVVDNNVVHKIDDNKNNEEEKDPQENENDDLESNFDGRDEDAHKLDDQLNDEEFQIVNSEESKKSDKKPSIPKPKEVNEDVVIAANSDQIEEEDSFFFVYFMMVCAVFILGYIGYHNKQKVLALVIEGRRGRRNSRRSGRPNSANYHKLDSNLEEAVTSSVHKNTTNIIY